LRRRFGDGLVAALVAVVGVLVCSIVDVRLVRPAFLIDLSTPSRVTMR